MAELELASASTSNIPMADQKAEATTQPSQKECPTCSAPLLDKTAKEQSQRITTPSTPQGTFNLYEFDQYGSDSHHFLWIQREGNSEIIDRFENKTDEAQARHGRVYTEADIENIKTSCLGILRSFEYTNDSVTFEVIRGKINIDASELGGNDMEDFEDVFGCSKSPNWQSGFGVEAAQHESLL